MPISLKRNSLVADDMNKKVQDTLNLIKQANQIINNSTTYKDIVLVLGNSGVGKTPFTKWMTEDNTKLISVKLAPGQPYLMQDIDHKIGTSTIKSATVFPDLFVNKTINQAYYDFPGFHDTRGVSYGIATMYSIQGVISNAQSVKMVFLVDYDSVKSAGSRDGFTNLMKTTSKFVKDIGKYANSIALVVSKVPKYINDEPLSNDEVIQLVANFIQDEVKPNLEKDDHKYYTQTIKFIDTILLKNGTDYPRIGLFRFPDKAGPFSNISWVQQGKERIEKIIYEKLHFTPVAKDDFICAIDAEYQNEISNIVEGIKNILTSHVKKIGAKIKQHFLHIEETVADVGLLYNKTSSGYYELSETQKNATILTSKECIELVSKNSATINSSVIDSTLLDTIIPYTDFLAFLDNNKISQQAISSFKCTTGLDKVVEYLNDAKTWYGFLNSLYNRLSECSTHQNIESYNIANLVIDKDRDQIVKNTNLKVFLDKVYSNHQVVYIIYNNIKDIILNELKFKQLKKVQGSASQYHLEHTSCAPSNVTQRNNLSVADLYDTLGFINEFDMYEMLFPKLHNRIDFLPFYDSLLNRVNAYSKNTKSYEQSEDHTTVLNYLRAAIVSNIFHLNNNQENAIIINIEYYFSLVTKHINDYKAALKEVSINKHREQYHKIINTQITNANDIIEKEILPEIDKIIKETNQNIDLLVNEVISMQDETKAQKQALVDQKHKLEEQLFARSMLGVLQVGSQVLALAGPYGAVAGAAINTISSATITELDETSSTGTNRITALPAGISKSWTKVTELLKIKQTNFEKQLYDAAQEVDKLLNQQPSNDIKEIKDKISKARDELKDEQKKGHTLDPASVDKMYNLRNEIIELVKEKAKIIDDNNRLTLKGIESALSDNNNKLKNEQKKGHTLDPASTDNKNTLHKERIELLTNKTKALEKQKSDQKIKEDRINKIITHVQTVISTGDAVYDVYNRMKNHNTKIGNLDDDIKKADKNIKKLESYERDIYNTIIPMINSMQANAKAASKDAQSKSHAVLDVSKWKIQSSIKDVQVKIQEMTKGFNVQPYLVRCIEKFEYGISTMIQIYDRIQDEYDKKQVADLITNVVSDAKIINNRILSDAIDKLELTIKSNLVLQEYEQAMSAFRQYIFPFAHKYLGQFELTNTYNNMSNCISNVITQISKLQDEVEKNHILIMPDMDTNMHPNAVFHSKNLQGPGPFFVWKHEIYQEEISALLQGKEIVINADIVQGIKHYATKFNEIGIYFKLFNTTLQQDLDTQLHTFQVQMTHLGNSYYRCGHQFYIINHSPVNITHYVMTNNDQYADANSIYLKIQKNLPILSPYTMWKIQLFHDHNDYTIFDQFTKYTNQSIDLELVGKGQYLRINDPVCKDNLKEYYKVADNILQLDSNHKHRHHHGENHHRERRDVDDANNMPYDINSITAAVSTIESILKPISDNTVNDIENNISNLEDQNIGMVDHISIEGISSSANRIKSPINTAIHWLSNSRLGQLKFFNPTNMINYEFIKDSIQSMFGESKQLNNYTTNYSNNAVNITKFNVNESLASADFIIRCVTKVKPYNTKEESINLLEVKAYVLNIITEFEEKLNELSVQNNLPIERLKYNPVYLMCKLEKEIINNNYTKIGKILHRSIINNNSNLDETQFSSYIQDKINEILEQQNAEYLHYQQLITDHTSNRHTIIEDMNNTIGITNDFNHTNYQSEINLIG